MGVDPEEQVQILQARIHERLAQLRAIGQSLRAGSGGHESRDPDDYFRDDAREIDLTDGIDLTDAKLAEARWDDDSEDESGDEEPGGVLEDGSPRRRSHRPRPDPGTMDDGDTGPRLLGERDDHEPDEQGDDDARGDRSRQVDLLTDVRAGNGGSGRLTLQEATDAVIEATRELIAYERRLPMLLDAEARRLSLLIVRWSGVLTAAVALSLLVAGLVGWLPRWWMLPAVICAGAGYLLLRLPVHPPGDRHEMLRPGSVVVAFGALLTAICAAAGMPLMVLLLAVVLIAAGIWHAQQTPLRIGALPRRFR